MVFGIKKLLSSVMVLGVLFLFLSVPSQDGAAAQPVIPPCKTAAICDEGRADGVSWQQISIESSRPGDALLIGMAATLAIVTGLAMAGKAAHLKNPPFS